jgi:hypothetical protein
MHVAVKQLTQLTVAVTDWTVVHLRTNSGRNLGISEKQYPVFKSQFYAVVLIRFRML